jgi:oxygen-independent coproporphyrinogen-3 oxidase
LAGIYIHIPFCKKACNYCDFHFSTSVQYKTELIDCLVLELKERIPYIDNETIETIYFGGGTPSLLTKEELKLLLDVVYENYTVSPTAEISLEANPDDLIKEKLTELKEIGINRLSIGIQSFIEGNLTWMNRSHSVKQAKKCIKIAQEIGFDNITIDLIYGIPNLSINEWKNNIKQAISLNVNHISAYCLTVEEKTALHYAIKKGETHMPCDEETSKQFKILIDELTANDFIHYEISSFGKQNFESKHNSAYWKQKKYLGIGPSAHSFDGKSRQWNISNNKRYINGAKANNWDFELETIDETTRYNEYMLTSLRTMWGVDLAYLNNNFSKEIITHFNTETLPFIKSEQMILKDNHFVLSPKGKLMADFIASELFWV